MRRSKICQPKPKQFQRIIQTLANLPPKHPQAHHTIVQIKNEQDKHNYYKYIDKDLELNKISSPEDIQLYLTKLLHLSQQKPLTNSQKFMLDQHICLYTQNIFNSGILADKDRKNKNKTPFSLKDLRVEWKSLQSSWELYKIRKVLCQIGPNHFRQQMEIKQEFKLMRNQIVKISSSKDKQQRIENLTKLMTKFYKLILA